MDILTLTIILCLSDTLMDYCLSCKLQYMINTLNDLKTRIIPTYLVELIERNPNKVQKKLLFFLKISNYNLHKQTLLLPHGTTSIN